jgi:hypothetical protein
MPHPERHTVTTEGPTFQNQIMTSKFNRMKTAARKSQLRAQKRKGWNSLRTSWGPIEDETE